VNNKKDQPSERHDSSHTQKAKKKKKVAKATVEKA
jgi:hypothetical protein